MAFFLGAARFFGAARRLGFGATSSSSDSLREAAFSASRRHTALNSPHFIAQPAVASTFAMSALRSSDASLTSSARATAAKRRTGMDSGMGWLSPRFSRPYVSVAGSVPKVGSTFLALGAARFGARRGGGGAAFFRGLFETGITSSSSSSSSSSSTESAFLGTAFFFAGARLRFGAAFCNDEDGFSKNSTNLPISFSLSTLPSKDFAERSTRHRSSMAVIWPFLNFARRSRSRGFSFASSSYTKPAKAARFLRTLPFAPLVLKTTLWRSSKASLFFASRMSSSTSGISPSGVPAPTFFSFFWGASMAMRSVDLRARLPSTIWDPL